MPSKPKCSICSHPERTRIEMLRLAGLSLDSTVTRFGLGEGGRDRLWRHMKNHVSASDRAALVADIPIQELAEKAASEGGSILDHLAIVRSGLMKLYVAAVGVGDARAAAPLAGRLAEVLRDQAALTGELLRGSQVNITNNNMVVLNSPAFADLQSMLVDVLRPHPAALRAVLEGIEELEKRAAGPLMIEADRAA